MTLLAKQPPERIQTADAVIAQIDAILGAATPGPMSVGAASVRGAFDATALGVPPSSARLSAAAISQRASNIANTARDLLDRALPEPVRTTFTGRFVRIAGRKVPTWALVAAATVVLIAGSILVARLGDEVSAEPSAVTTSIAQPERDLDAELRENVEKARTGDPAAIAALQKRPSGERAAAEWQALAQGLFKIRQPRAAVDAYAGAVGKDAGLANDPKLLSDVRRAAEQSESSEAALRLSASSLGAAGADLLYDVWMAFRRSKEWPDLGERARALLESEDARKHASPALRVALDLHAARGCTVYKELMGRAVQYADERSVPLLKPLGHTRGCGFLGLGDCYTCLRSTMELSDAMKNAQTRPAPTFSAGPSASSGSGR